MHAEDESQVAAPVAPAKRSVQELMRPYYGGTCFDSSTYEVHALNTIFQPKATFLAAKIFPHHEMYRWLSYGNGE